MNARTTYLFVILETVLVLVCLLTANDGTAEGLCLFARETEALNELLFTEAFRQFAVVSELTRVLEAAHAALLAEKTLGGVVNAARLILLAVHVGEAKARHAGVEIRGVHLARSVHSRLGWADSLGCLTKGGRIHR